MLFENCFSHAPVTSSSFASILSGFLPHETKVLENFPLSPQVPTLPQILKRHKYKTIGVVSNYNLRKETGWAKGFTLYDDEMANFEIVRNLPERIAEYTTNRAVEFLKQYQKERLFMWIHYQDPHGPYTPPERFSNLFLHPHREPHNLSLNQSMSGYGGIPLYQKLGANRDFYYYMSQYDREIRYFDEQFKTLIDALKDLDLYDDSMIIFLSDHGEGMGKHNYYFAHGENLYNSLLHVPLIIKYGNELKGRRSDYVQHIDIVPTILNVIGKNTDLPFRGTDLRRPSVINKEIYAEMASPMVRDGIKFSITVEGLKLIYTLLNKRIELFDLKNDPYEEHDLVGNFDYQASAKELLSRLKRIHDEDLLGLNTIKKPRQMTKDEIEKMRSLGYVQ